MQELFFENLPTLQSERLLLRKMELSDAGAIYAYCSNPVFYKSMGRQIPISEEKVRSDIRELLEADNNRRPRNWVVLLKSINKAIGDCGFNLYRPDNLRGEINYAIDPDYWDQGFASEAVQCLLGFAFKSLNLNRIQAICHPTNKRSESVIQKAGMKYEGLLREYIQFEGKSLDMKIYSILREGWLSNCHD